ncbi:N-ethylmaleimide reductase protein [Rutstroemia sp. NJR-2017a BBW]|nr:N-ethylmaleimide reductase protein [Rutstroemia sp. NJR-2017a BBW]
MLCCKVWCALVIPTHISLRLLRELQKANDDPVWEDHPELLLWLLYIGGAFTTTETVRSDYVILLRLNTSSRLRGLYKSWQELHEILKRFIWSDAAFTPHVKALWEEVTI